VLSIKYPFFINFVYEKLFAHWVQNVRMLATELSQKDNSEKLSVNAGTTHSCEHRRRRPSEVIEFSEKIQGLMMINCNAFTILFLHSARELFALFYPREKGH
jgi:hypothetical protein